MRRLDFDRLTGWLLTRRAAGQSVVDFGLGIAAVAFVAMVGFQALSSAQSAYWGASAPTLAAPTPAPGDFLHPTSVDPPSCAPSPAILGMQLTCSTTVRDAYANAFDRRTPNGTLQWYIDGTTLGPPCTLNVPTTSTNACSAPLVWTPTDPSLTTGSHSISALYSPTGSNHNGSTGSTPVPFQAQPTPNVDISCNNDYRNFQLPGTPPTTQVALGYPIRCTATVTVGTAPLTAPITKDTVVTWSTDNGSACSPACKGVGVISCFTGYDSATQTELLADVWNSGQCPQPQVVDNGTAQFTCKTDNYGVCSIIYRRIYDNTIDALMTYAPLRAQVYSVVQPAPRIDIVSPNIQSPNPAGMSVHCTSADPRVTLANFGGAGDPNPAIVNFGNAKFPSTSTVTVHPSATVHGTISCVPYVMDDSQSPAQYGLLTPMPSGDPDFATAFPPMGKVYVTFGGDPSTRISCTLQRVNYSATNPQQAVGQAPFYSSCPSAIVVPDLVPGGQNNFLTFEFPTETISYPTPLGDAAHGFASYSIPVTFN